VQRPDQGAPQARSRRPGGSALHRQSRGARRHLAQELAAVSWQQYGACRTADQSLFFGPDSPKEPRDVRVRRLMAAKRICAGCPVRELCRRYALENEEEFGVWGGLSESERKQLIAERR
jgi:WhiB family redox-sensing transcriptional regulator